jgi:polyhydroxyalkanoate synthesis regulator phasin
VERTKIPAIRLWCDSDQCDGFRNFDPIDSEDDLAVLDNEKGFRDTFVLFVCRNCRQSTKKYAISYAYSFAKKELVAVKLGEYPPLSFHLPARLRKLVGTELKKFNKGLRSEAHGLGVGAFAYYRQVLENQKGRLIDEIVKVGKLHSPPPQELLEELEQAKRETQFTSAVEKIKHGLPEVLLINSENPLTLLYKALSEDLHNGTDEDVLRSPRIFGWFSRNSANGFTPL